MEENRAIEVKLEDMLNESFSRYAGMVIQQRALIDVRDALKPSARQLLYAQYLEKLTHDKPFRKSAKSVAAGLNYFYTHGDASAYSTLMRLGKPFATRYPLEEVQGSYGNLIKTGNEASQRYTEMRLSPLAAQLFQNINKGTIDVWYDNYDDTEKYPSVLPSVGYYNIVQGTQGIGVALASSIPQFNLREVNNALIKLLWDPATSYDDLYCAPDFATGGIIVNESEVKESLKIGKGKAAKVRGRIEYDAKTHQLLVKEFPYGVYSDTICKQLSEKIEEDNTSGIEKFIDLTGENPLIKITLNKKANPEKVKQWLYKNTSIQYHFGINMVMLQNGVSPKIFGWKEALEEYLDHSKVVLIKELEFDLQKAKNRLHIVEGYLKALSIIDEVVATIRASENSAAAALALISEFSFSEVQAKAILDLKLQRLVNLEVNKLKKEKDKLLEEIERITFTLNDQTAFFKIIEQRLVEVAKKFGDERRTVIMDIASVDFDEPIIEQNIVVTITKNGLIYPLKIDDFVVQNRGGRGLNLKIKPGDYVLNTIYASNLDQILMFSNLGKAYTLKIAELPIGVETYTNAYFDLSFEEYITQVIPYNKMNDYKYIVFATRQGLIKKSLLNEYQAKRKGGLQGIKLRAGDTVVGVGTITDDSDNIVIITKKGYTLIYNQDKVPLTGRVTSGVKSINLGEGDEVVSLAVFNDVNHVDGIVTVTNSGLAKNTPATEFSVTNRALKGVICQKFKTNDDYITAFTIVYKDTKEILCVSSNSIIRMKMSDLQRSKRDTIGTKLMKLKSDERVTEIVPLST